jgi:2-methylcitrate dehydratase
LRRAEGIALLTAKFEAAVRAHYPARQAESVLAMFADANALHALPVPELMGRLALD